MTLRFNVWDSLEAVTANSLVGNVWSNNVQVSTVVAQFGAGLTSNFLDVVTSLISVDFGGLAPRCPDSECFVSLISMKSVFDMTDILWMRETQLPGATDLVLLDSRVFPFPEPLSFAYRITIATPEPGGAILVMMGLFSLAFRKSER